MNKRILRDFVDLTGAGFRVYSGEIMHGVYDELGCADPTKAFWLARWPILHCLGCKKRCTPAKPTGFQIQLPDALPDHLPTVAQLLAYGRPLSVDEVAFCLGVSRRQVYDLQFSIDSELIFLQDKPLRCTPESVRAEMTRTE